MALAASTLCIVEAKITDGGDPETTAVVTEDLVSGDDVGDATAMARAIEWAKGIVSSGTYSGWYIYHVRFWRVTEITGVVA